MAFLLYVLALWPGRNKIFQPSIDYALLFLCMAMFNPNAWLINYVTFIFSYMFIIYYLLRTRPFDKKTLILLLGAFLLTSAANEFMAGDKFQNLFEELSSVTIGAMVLFLTLGRLKYARQS